MCIRDRPHAEEDEAKDCHSGNWSRVQTVQLTESIASYAEARNDDSPTDTSNRPNCRKPAHIGSQPQSCLLYTSDAAAERSSVDLGGRRIIKKKTQQKKKKEKKNK